MSVLAAIATGKPGFDYLRTYLGNIVLGDDVAIGGTGDSTVHTAPNHTLPIPLPLALPTIGGRAGGGMDSRNAVKNTSVPMSMDGPGPIAAGRLSEDGHASAVAHFKVED